MRFVPIVVTALAALLVVPVIRSQAGEEEAPRKPEIGDLAWMAGTWRADSGPMPFEEHWTAPWGGTMAAVSRGQKDGAVVMLELSSIETVGTDLVLHLRHFDAGLKPWADEAGGPLAWTLTSSTRDRAVFTDPEQEFPRNVIYEREDKVLRAILEGGKPEQPMRMVFTLKRVD